MARTEWNIDGAHSGINFSVRHMVISKVRGRFAKWEGRVEVEDDDFARAKLEVSIDAASIDTGVADRDTHLRSPDFLDAAKYPRLVYKSKRVKRLDDRRYQVVGDLTIRDVTREVVLDVAFEGRAKDPWGNERAGFSASAKLDRKEYGLKWNQALETGGVLVGEQVEIAIEVEAVYQAAAQVA